MTGIVKLIYVMSKSANGFDKPRILRYDRSYPNADKVIEYAESQIGKPYCEGWDFITAKSRTSCFICTTITWRSFDREGFNIHRVWARWMPTIAPADVYLSSHVKRKHRIK